MSELSMNTDPVSQNGDTEVKQMNFIQRVLGIFISPGEAMRNLAVRPRILLPFLVVALAALCANLVRYPIYSETIKQTTINSTEAMIEKMGDKFTEEQIKDMRDKAASKSESSIVQGLAATPVASLASWLFGTLVLFLVAKIFKGQGKYKHYLSLTGYAYLIMVLYTIINVIVSFFTGNLKLDFSPAMTSNVLLQGGAGTFLYGFTYTILRSFDLFSIWYYIVIAIGLMEIGKLSKTKAYIVVSIVFLLSVLFGATMAGVGEHFTNAVSTQL